MAHVTRFVTNVLVYASALTAVAFSGCAGTIKPDDMSAAAHRREAARDKASAEADRRQYDANATTIPLPPLPPREAIETADVDSTENPTAWHLTQAAKMSEHAKRHLAAARDLDAYEAAECKSIPAGERSGCPMMGPITKMENIAIGVRVEFASGTDVAAVVARMQCHLAYARDKGFPADLDCPLYLKGAHVNRSSNGRGVEITATEPGVISKIQRQSREIFRLGSGEQPIP